jgi:putative PEP-CTERM system histidine kinase
MKIYALVPFIQALISLATGFLLLTRRRKKLATLALGGAAALQGLMALCFFMAFRDYPSALEPIYIKWSLLFVSFNPILIVNFSFHHTQMDFPLLPGIKKAAIPMVTCAGILFSLLPFHSSFLKGIDLVSDEWAVIFGPTGSAFGVYLILSILVILFQMEQTFRNTQAVQRHQLNYLLLGITFGSLYSLFLASILLLYRYVYLELIMAGCVVYSICWGMIAFAVIRYQLLDMRIFISRHVIFTSISALGVGIYLVVMGLVGYLLRSRMGRWDIFLSAIFISIALILLAVILLSSTLQKSLKHFINVHFYRYKYDYRLEWNEFTKKISEVNDLPNLLLKIIEMISDTLWVNQLSVWLYNERSGNLSFNTSRNLPRKAEFLSKDTPLAQYLLHHSMPLDVKSPEVQSIVSNHQDLFNRFHIALILPLKLASRLVGMITLGAEMKGIDYSEEDYELLKTIALQASSAIFNAQLIEEMAVAKEAESFNKISSFLVHDLKNLVSSLSLIFQNAERNITKPEFQKDLLTTLQNTVEKMKTLIEKLSTLPKELDIKKTSVDINHLVREAIESTKAAKMKGVVLSTDLYDVPPAKADGEYIKKVLVNMILNAVQSLPGGKGRVEIASYAKDGYIHVEVLDSGVGMDEDFIKKQLFKPFTSTKKKGLGIGLYQCKTIMEAHGGVIEVSSIPSRGTQFILRIPAG